MMRLSRSRTRRFGGATLRRRGPRASTAVTTDTRTLVRRRPVRRAERRALRRPRLPRAGGAARRGRRARAESGSTSGTGRCAPAARRRRHAAGARAGSRLTGAPVRAAAGRGDRQQRQDHGEGNARRDPARSERGDEAVLATAATSTTTSACRSRCCACAPASLRRGRDGHEPRRRDPLPRAARAPDVALVNNASARTSGILRLGRGDRARKGRDLRRARPTAASR